MRRSLKVLAALMTAIIIFSTLLSAQPNYIPPPRKTKNNGFPGFEQSISAEPNVRSHHIPWAFLVYAEPDFRSEHIARFDPQSIDILYENGSGWALISTAYGQNWVYLHENRRYIDRTMGTFEQKGDYTHTSIIYPQVVSVLEQDENWLRVETWLGQKWIDLYFVPPSNELDYALRRFGNAISVYYENIDTGHVYVHNAERVYFSASVPKAMLALYIYQKAERGETCLDSVHTYTQADHVGGSGVIIHEHGIGTTFTQGELLRLNLSESDNIATNILRRIHGLEGYREFVAGFGGNQGFIGSTIMNGSLTANEAGLYAREIYSYIESGGRYSDEFKTHLLNNQFPFIVSDYPVASKTGWTQSVQHDMAIVYAPSKYILVILTDRNRFNLSESDFAEISMAFQYFNDQWYSN